MLAGWQLGHFGVERSNRRSHHCDVGFGRGSNHSTHVTLEAFENEQLAFAFSIVLSSHYKTYKSTPKRRQASQ
jgi:hypothetical protein